MAQKGLWNLAKEKIMKERGKLPNQEGDAVRESKAMREETSWATGQGKMWQENKKGRRKFVKRMKKKGGEKRKREKEKENQTVRVKWRIDGLLKSLVKGEIWRVVAVFLGGTSWTSMRTCLIVSLLLVRVCVWCLMWLMCLFPLLLWSLSFVRFFRVSPMVKMLCSPFHSPKKRAHCCTSTQEEMRYESPQVKAHPSSRRRMMPPTPLQNSNHTFEEEQGLLGRRSHVECERKNDNCKNETVCGKKLRCESGSWRIGRSAGSRWCLWCWCGIPANPERSKRWKRVRDIWDFQHGWFEWIPGQSVAMGQVQKKMERTIETKFVGLCKWRMVARRSGTAESRMEFDGKKGLCRQWKITWKFAPTWKWTLRFWRACWSQKT